MHAIQRLHRRLSKLDCSLAIHLNPPDLIIYKRLQGVKGRLEGPAALLDGHSNSREDKRRNSFSPDLPIIVAVSINTAHTHTR